MAIPSAASAVSSAQPRTFAGTAPQAPVRNAAGTASAAGGFPANSVETLPEDMSAAVRELSDALRTTTIGLQFEIDETTHKVITKVIDRDTGELIRQLPSEEIMRIARAMNKLQGLLVHQSA